MNHPLSADMLMELLNIALSGLLQRRSRVQVCGCLVPVQQLLLQIQLSSQYLYYTHNEKKRTDYKGASD